MSEYTPGRIAPANTTAFAAPVSVSARRLRRIGVGSAFRVGGALAGLLFAFIGFFVILLPGLFGASILGAAFGARGGGGVLFASVLGYVFGLLAYAVIGGLFSALYAWLYNLVAGWFGGIAIELDGD